MKKKVKFKIVWRSFLLRIFILICITFLSYAGALGYKLYKMEAKIVELAKTDQEDPIQTKGILETAKTLLTNEKVPLREDSSGRTNILLLGMSGEGYKSQYLTDTIMLVSIDKKNYRSAMLSIPRDLYVKIPNTNDWHTKINAVYTFSIKNRSLSSSESMGNIKTVIQEVTGQPVHYYLTLDFAGFKKIVAELGGIDLEVKQDIYDNRYPGPNYSYETFELKKGFQHLDAETALKYARVRHIKGGDFGRAARQQQVIAAAKKKAFSLGTIANPAKINSLIDVLGDHLRTDIQLAEIPTFIDLADKINIYQTTSRVLDAWSRDSLLGSTHVEMGGVMAYVLIPKAKNYRQVHELSENIFELEKIKRKQAQIAKENAKLAVLLEDKSNRSKIKTAFNNLGYKPIINPRSNELPSCPRESTLFSLSQNKKVFTLDDLTTKLEAKVVYHTPTYPETAVTTEANRDDESSSQSIDPTKAAKQNSPQFDIAICLSSDTLQYLTKQNKRSEELSQNSSSQDIIDADGNVLFKQE